MHSEFAMFSLNFQYYCSCQKNLLVFYYWKLEANMNSNKFHALCSNKFVYFKFIIKIYIEFIFAHFCTVKSLLKLSKKKSVSFYSQT